MSYSLLCFNMLKGRNMPFLNKNKSKLVIGRPSSLHQYIQSQQENKNLLEVKPLTLFRNEKISPFRIKTTSNSLKNREPSVKQDMLSSQSNKIQLKTLPTKENRLIEQERKVETQSLKTESLQRQPDPVNKFLDTLISSRIIKEQQGNYIIPAFCLKQLLTPLHYIQAGQQLEDKLIKSIQKTKSQSTHENTEFCAGNSKPVLKGNNLKISNLINICQNVIRIRQIEEMPEEIYPLQNKRTTSLLVQNEPNQTKLNQSETKLESNTVLVISKQTKDSQVQFDGHSGIYKTQYPTATEISTFCQSEFEQFKANHLQEMQRYILNQPNKIVQMASTTHKIVEQEMFHYADFLRTNRLGTSTYITDVNMNSLDTLVSKELKQMNKRLIQGQDEIVVKCRLMRDFITRTRERYDNLLKEMMMVIDKKTEFCRQFVNKVNKWFQNYQARSEYLANLKEEYCQELFMLHSQFAKIRQKLNSTSSSAEIEEIIKCSTKRLFKIDELILIGNNFY